ncbi:copper chaperone PCu(A)C [Novosphingobium umbonatum]|uniref:Copper chaperone PCu(A)C n=1 Tax=Novosphingobium umbonatum TaxID=1908524 RepID=A0A3S2Y8Y0_9SPHN|nr:copper chaperone PCu(A)C [Novosphingobium umbonatum]RVU06240.1 copper chaperone PCu(A)C [Novosphingobium umbonatum]
MKPVTFAPALLALSLLAVAALSACHKHEEPASPAAPTEASTGEQASATPSGSLVLPAVAGNPAAAYPLWRNTEKAPVTITSVEIRGAGAAEMHETKGQEMVPVDKITVAPHGTLPFARGGNHVMVFDMPASAKAGDKLPYTLVLSDGRKLEGTLSAEAPGGMASGMSGMDHQH